MLDPSREKQPSHLPRGQRIEFEKGCVREEEKGERRANPIIGLPLVRRRPASPSISSNRSTDIFSLIRVRFHLSIESIGKLVEP